MRRLRGLPLLLIVVACALALVAPLQAQSGTTAAVSGTVTGPGGAPIGGALVTLTSLDRGGTREETADATGSFRFSLLAPGSYELRAEALGYRPVVARTLALSSGSRASLELPLAAAPPPVETVDTIAISAATAGHFVPGGLRLGSRELDGLPHRNQDLSSVVALDTHVDASLGAQGLPASMSQTVVDGVPVYRAPHPLARGEYTAGPAFPRTALSTVTVRRFGDVEWGGAAGAQLGLTTLTGTAGRGVSLEGAWTGAPLWSSSELDISKPSLLSFEGAGRATVAVTPGTSQLVMAGELFRQDTPLTPRISDAGAADLTGLDPDLVRELTDPSVETYSRYSGLLRFDSQAPGSYLFARGAVGYSMREFDGPGPVMLTRDAALPEKSLEYSFASGYTREVSPDVSFELRGGVAGANRTFDPAAAGMPAAFLAESGSALGVYPVSAGESSRTDILVSPVLGYGLGDGILRLGVNARLTKQALAASRPFEHFFSDGAALVAGRGYETQGTAADASFWTRELGGFARFDSELGPGLQLSLGARFDYEWIADEVALDTDWLQASGLRNDAYPTGFGQLGGHLGLTWDPDAATRISTSLYAQHGDVDPRFQARTLDADATRSTYVGTGVSWPGATIPAGASTRSTLALLGPDTRAPRSMGGSVGVVRELFDGWSVHLGGDFRRTDFLMRSRDLNLPVMAQAVDPNGRGVYGTLTQDGALVTATGDDVRRFSDFGTVWALDPDGWSEYVAATGGVEYSNASFDLLGSYTYSETTDNWIGAAGGTIEAGLPPLLPEETWSEGTSDFDVPHRATFTATARLSLATISAAYRFRSGLPFTPSYRDGVDANGDGSLRNDVAYVDAAVVDPLLSDWPCLEDQIGGFAVRNSCRGPSVHSLDLRFQVSVGTIAGREASLIVDGFNLIESGDGIIDDALLLVDPSGSITTSGGVVTIPFVVNPSFGQVLYSTSRGRMLRVGFRIG